MFNKYRCVLICVAVMVVYAVNGYCLNRVYLGPEYFPKSDIGRPVAGGEIYVGKPDTDPTIEANQKQVTIQEEDGGLIEISQPVDISTGGVPEYNGSPVTIFVDGDYSLRVNNSAGSQVYYIPNTGSALGFNPGNYYYPSSDASDHGVTGDSNTVKYYVDQIGSDEATLYFKHDSGGVTTAYTFTTALTIPSNVTLEFENGARLVPASSIDVTVYSPSKILPQSGDVPFDGDGDVIYTTTGDLTLTATQLGLIAGDTSTAVRSRNTDLLRRYISPEADWGIDDDLPIHITFGGNETWYFNGLITIKSNVTLDLSGATLQADYTCDSTNTSSGFLYGVRKFVVKNGTVVLNATNPSNIVSSAVVIKIGNRGNSGDYWQESWDKLLAEEQGNVTLERLKLIVSSTGTTDQAYGALLIGGLNNTTLENINVECDHDDFLGVYYEWGWATDDANSYDRETSHAYNLKITNLSVNNTDLTSSTDSVALGIRGAYNAHVDGMYTNEIGTVFDGSPGESAFYNPWDPRDIVGAKANILLENVVGKANKVGLSLDGSVTSGYLVDGGVLTGDDRYGICDYTVNNFTLSGTTASTWGISNTSRNTKLTNGSISTFQRGVFSTQPGLDSALILDNVSILDCQENGVDISTVSGSYVLAGEIRNCTIAGNGTNETVGDQSGIKIADVENFLIENNTFGNETELYQLYSVDVKSGAFGVTVRNNNTRDVKNTGYAYSYYTNSTSTIRNIVLDSNRGINTSNGWWDRVGETSRTIPTEGTYVRGNTIKAVVPSVGTAPAWQCVSSSNTALDGGEPSGETTISVVSGSDISDGDTIGVMQDDGTILWSTVSSGGGTNTLVIADALTDDAADGNVVFTHLLASYANLI